MPKVWAERLREIGRAKEAERRRGGVEVEDSTRGELSDLAEAAGLSPQFGFA